MKKVIFILLMSSMFLFASAENSFACSCVASLKPVKQQVKESYADSTAIFSGEVTEITSKDEWSVIVKFKVVKSWKSKLSKEIMITTNKQSAMCGYYFEAGKKYLVYAYGAKDDLSTNNYSRTTPVGNKVDIKFLDKLNRTKGRSA